MCASVVHAAARFCGSSLPRIASRPTGSVTSPRSAATIADKQPVRFPSSRSSSPVSFNTRWASSQSPVSRRAEARLIEATSTYARAPNRRASAIASRAASAAAFGSLAASASEMFRKARDRFSKSPADSDSRAAW